MLLSVLFKNNKTLTIPVKRAFVSNQPDSTYDICYEPCTDDYTTKRIPSDEITAWSLTEAMDFDPDLLKDDIIEWVLYMAENNAMLLKNFGKDSIMNVTTRKLKNLLEQSDTEDEQEPEPETLPDEDDDHYHTSNISGYTGYYPKA